MQHYYFSFFLLHIYIYNTKITINPSPLLQYSSNTFFFFFSYRNDVFQSGLVRTACRTVFNMKNTLLDHRFQISFWFQEAIYPVLATSVYGCEITVLLADFFPYGFGIRLTKSSVEIHRITVGLVSYMGGGLHNFFSNFFLIKASPYRN